MPSWMGWGRFLGLTATGRTWWILWWRSTLLAKPCVIWTEQFIPNPTLNTEPKYLMYIVFPFFFQVCTKILEKNANPQWNQSLSMPIRVIHTHTNRAKHMLLWNFIVLPRQVNSSLSSSYSIFFLFPSQFPSMCEKLRIRILDWWIPHVILLIFLIYQTLQNIKNFAWNLSLKQAFSKSDFVGPPS